MDSNSRPLAIAMAAVTVVFWAASYQWSKVVLGYLDPVWTAEIRYGLAAIVLLAVTLPSGQVAGAFRGNWRNYLLIGIIGFAVYPLLILGAIAQTSALNASVVMALSPVLTMLGAGLFLGEELNGRMVIGLVIAVAGAVVAVLGDNPRGLAGLTLDYGEPLALVAAVCLSFYTIAQRKLLSPSVPSIVSVALMLTIGAVLLLPITLIFGKLPTTPPSAAVIWSMLPVSLLSTALAFVLWLRATQVVGVDIPNLLFNFIPVLTMIFTWVAGTPPFPMQILGAVLVVAGVTVAAWKHRHPHVMGRAA